VCFGCSWSNILCSFNRYSQWPSTPNCFKMSRIRQNFAENCEQLINKQINLELRAYYVYLSMSYFFHRDDQALHGFAKFFKKSSDEERDHAEKFMEYQNLRGGTIVLEAILWIWIISLVAIWRQCCQNSFYNVLFDSVGLTAFYSLRMPNFILCSSEGGIEGPRAIIKWHFEA